MYVLKKAFQDKNNTEQVPFLFLHSFIGHKTMINVSQKYHY